jgi:tRNA(fMet)-specific endonuclease VapC
MKFVALDTNAYSALQKGNPVVSDMVRKATDIGLPITVLGEIYYGVFDGNKTTENSSNLQKFLSVERVNVLQSDEKTAELFGEIATELKILGKPMQQNDMWIAALCKQHGYALVSNDLGFKNIVGLTLVSF